MALPVEAIDPLATVAVAVITGAFMWVTARHGRAPAIADANAGHVESGLLIDLVNDLREDLGEAQARIGVLERERTAHERALAEAQHRIGVLERERSAHELERTSLLHQMDDLRTQVSVLELALTYIGELTSNWPGAEALPHPPRQLLPYLADLGRRTLRRSDHS